MLLLEQPIERQTNGLDPVYAQFRDHTRFWIQRVAVPFLMVIGLFGNSITVIIMTRRRMRSTTNMYLAALALVDMLYLVLTFLLGLSHYPNMAGYKYYVYWKLRPFLMMLTDACSNASVWLTVTFTIERYIAVKYPMKGKVWCTEERAKMLIISVFAFGMLFASPVPFEWKVIEKRNFDKKPAVIIEEEGKELMQNASNLSPPVETSGRLAEELIVIDKNTSYKNIENATITDSSIFFLDYSDFGRNETYKTIYYSLTAIIFYFIPLFSLTLFNGFLIKSVHRSQRERRKMTTLATGRQITMQQLNLKQYSQPKIGINILMNIKNSRPLDVQDTRAKKYSINNQGKFKLYNYITPIKYKRNRKFRTKTNDSCNIIQKSGQSFPLIEQKSSEQKNNFYLDSLQRQNFTQSTINFVDGTLNSPNLDATINPIGLKGINVQRNCDNESVVIEQAQENVINQSKTNNLNENSIPERQASNCSRETIKTIEGMPARNKQSATKTQNTTNTAYSSSSQQTNVPVSTQERRITIMLIAVVILFLICQIPTAAMLLYTSFHETVPNTNEHALVLAFGNIFNFLMAVNAAGNFILYSFLSKKYRITFMILFCRCFGYKQKHNQHNRIINSVRFETSTTQSQYRGGTSIRKSIDTCQRDTLV